MARSKKLIDTLKRKLRNEGITYKHIASELELSEASVKLMFAKHKFTLERLDSVCQMLDLEISDLAQIAEDDVPTISQLPLSFEKELVADMRLLLVAYCIMNSWKIHDIINHYELSEAECIGYLSQLDKMKMIELQPNNRVRLLISPNFEWHANGPIERFFRQQVQTQFFNADFSKNGELRLVKNGSISPTSRLKLVERLNAIGEQFEELNHADRHIDSTDKHGTTMVVAIRQWEFQVFKVLER